jgi:hypothetical protein
MNREVMRLSIAALILILSVRKVSADEKELEANVQNAFKRFAAAVKDNKYDEAARWISPPADKVWTNFGLMRSAAAKYDEALEDKFGKGKGSYLSGQWWGDKQFLAEQFYETQGEIREVKTVGKDRAHVRVWTKRPDWAKRSESALYERKFTAVRIGDQWKFQLHTFGGTPVLKKVKRTAPDGKEVEVYAEHNPKGANVKDWEELEPISYDGREEVLKREALNWAKFTEILGTQTEQVKKGAYKTRDEALGAITKAMRTIETLK